MFSGDETGALVVDFGSHTSKFGYAGEDGPRVIRRNMNSSFQDEFVKGTTQVLNGIDPKDHPVVCVVPSVGISDAEKISRASVVFESGFPGAFFIRSAVAGAFASGKSTALVVEIGASATTVVPVYEGFSLLKCTKRSEQAGADRISNRLAEKLAASFPVPKNTTTAALMSSYWDRVDDAKHSTCRVWRIPPFDETIAKELDPVSYELPDGKRVFLGPERFEVCESMFTPSEDGISTLIYNALGDCQPDLRRMFTQEILLIGGGSLMDGIPERIGFELTDRLPFAFKPKISLPGTASERRFAPFVGASVLASLGSFQQLWISAQEWQEQEGRILLERCVQ